MLHIYTASAGSGKTFTLARQFLLLALHSDYAYKKILAVTFTNKATAEMKSRILEELIKLAKSEKSAHLDFLCQELKIGEEEVRQRAAGRLYAILHDYQNLRISTIDSFFQSVIRSLKRELRLDLQSDIELDADTIKEFMIERLMEKSETSDEITLSIIRLAEILFQDGKNWNIRSNLSMLSNKFLNETQIDWEHDLESLRDQPQLAQTLSDEFNAYTKPLEEELKKIGTQALELLAQNGLDITHCSYGKSGFYSSLDKMIKGDLWSNALGKRLVDVAEGNANMFNKDSKKNLSLDFADIESRMQTLLQSAISLHNRHQKKYLSLKTINTYLPYMSLMVQLADCLKEYRKEMRKMPISDSAILLQNVLQNANSSFVYEKIGTQIQHFLLDEFQDTSQLQWKNFAPLLKDSLASGQFSLIVGDVKQSIYRWRNGDWRLLYQEVEKEIEALSELQKHNLAENYRSFSNIIDFNNLFFAQAIKNWQVSKEKKGEDDVQDSGILNPTEEALRDLFGEEKITQNKHAHTPQGGYIEITLQKKEDKAASADNTNEEDEDNEQLETDFRLNVFMQQLQSVFDRGFRPGDVAVLVRTGAEAEAVSSFLLQYALDHPDDPRSYRFVSNESLKLGASLALNCLMAAIKTVLRPKHALTKREFTRLYTDFATNLPPSANKLDPAAVLEKLETIEHTFVPELISKLWALLDMQNAHFDQAYLCAFEDNLQKFENVDFVSAPQLLEWWDNKGAKAQLNTAESSDAIQIMTIHKAKGLEFPVVFLPFLSWAFPKSKNQRDPVVWLQKPEEIDLPYRILPLPNKPETLNLSYFQPQLQEEEWLVEMDKINLAYVAFTRPVQALFIQLGGKYFYSKGAPFWKGILESMQLKAETLDVPSEYEKWTLGSMESLQPQKGKKAQTEYLSNTIDLTYQQPASSLFRQSAEESEEQTVGLMLHAWMAEIKTLDDVQGVFNRINTELPEPDARSLREQIEFVLRQPDANEWFSSTAEIFTERNLITSDGPIRPDRTVLYPDKVLVLDYKTGKPLPAHEQQMDLYKQHLSKLYNRPVKSILLYTQEKERVNA